MGAFAAPTFPSLHENTVEARPLTLLVREARCADCLWPTVCAGDLTCWRDERAERRRLRRLQRVAPPAVAGPVTVRNRETLGQGILRVVSSDGNSTAELARLLEKEDRNVYQAAKRLVTDGLLVAVRRGPRAGGNLWKKTP